MKKQYINPVAHAVRVETQHFLLNYSVKEYQNVKTSNVVGDIEEE